MRSKVSLLSFAVIVGFVGSAEALEFDKIQAANGLAGIIAKAEHCGYKIDENAIEAYFVDAGLATPEGLAFIQSNIDIEGLSGKPSATECTLAKTTARSIGVLTE